MDVSTVTASTTLTRAILAALLTAYPVPQAVPYAIRTGAHETGSERVSTTGFLVWDVAGQRTTATVTVLTGPAGPTAVSADADNVALLGTDGLIYVAPGAGTVSSVNGQVGAVVLTIPDSPDDIGAAPALVDAVSLAAGRALALSDAGKAIEITSASPSDLTIPAAADTAFPVGCVIEVYQGGAGQVSIVGAPGVTIESRGGLTDLAGQYAVASIRKRASDTWVLAGDLT